ncbi:MAG: hypothetical protein ABIR68_01045 [Ilumatobacteraceae bacterium]
MRKQLMIALTGLALAATACGSTAADPPRVTPPPSTAAPATTAAAAAPTTDTPATTSGATPGSDVAVKLATSPYGQILVDAQGRTLYAFLNDVNFQSTCTGTCAEAWPPVVVDANWNVAPGLDSGIFSTTVRADDKHEQLMIGRYPLYYFSGDAKPGDFNGQASGDVWFVVDKAAKVIGADGDAPAGGATSTTAAPATGSTPSPDTRADSGPDAGPGTTVAGADSSSDAAGNAPLVTTGDSALGTILVDAAGQTMYGFTKDVDGVPTCVDGCAKAWPPVIVSDVAAKALADSKLDQSLFSIVERPDGQHQLKIGKWPMYTFSGDTGAGEINGQGSGTSWFVIGPDSKLIKN